VATVGRAHGATDQYKHLYSTLDHHGGSGAGYAIQTQLQCMKRIFLMIGALAACVVSAAPACEIPADFAAVVSRKSAALAPSRFSGISAQLVTIEILQRLGPAARDVGSGLIALQWDVTDGRVFTVSTFGLCKRPLHAGFGKYVPVQIHSSNR